PIGHLLGTYWAPIGHLLGTYWAPIGHLLGTYWVKIQWMAPIEKWMALIEAQFWAVACVKRLTVYPNRPVM
ncbi:MAG: hypothetical protein MUC43_00920, partial [Pirellula sp.]|nr:hypothetical protein [Pirellula sp.]